MLCSSALSCVLFELQFQRNWHVGTFIESYKENPVLKIILHGRSNAELGRWINITEVFLQLYALIAGGFGFIGFFKMLEGEFSHWSAVVLIVAWTVLTIDYFVRFWLAEQRLEFYRNHRFDLICILVPFLRTYRTSRWEPARTLGCKSPLTGKGRPPQWLLSPSVISFLREGGGFDTVVTVVGIVMVGAVLVLAVESGSGGPIDDIWPAIWWTIGTMTTVGYGDVVPVTTAGQIVGVLVMVSGIGLFGLIVARVAAWVVGRQVDISNREMLDRLTNELQSLREELNVNDRSRR